MVQVKIEGLQFDVGEEGPEAVLDDRSYGGRETHGTHYDAVSDLPPVAFLQSRDHYQVRTAAGVDHKTVLGSEAATKLVLETHYLLAAGQPPAADKGLGGRIDFVVIEERSGVLHPGFAWDEIFARVDVGWQAHR